MNQSTPAVSAIIKRKDFQEEEVNEVEPKKKTRDEWRKAKELEEARKAGTAPALVDEEGKDINPHIPQYISSTPWYFEADGPTLKHQRQPEEKVKEIAQISDHFIRGQKGATATRYRRGACENCGAVTHKKKDCLERPRKIGAKYSGEDFAADEHILPNLSLGFDGKRDRWNGFEPEMYKSVIEEHQKVEEAKRVIKEEKLKQDLLNEETAKEGVESDSDEDEDEKYADHIDMPGTKVDSKQRITVRNLRIREDTAKYLRNLDLDSAYYDPKTRAMRENPYKTTGKSADELQYAGDNFVRFTGDTTEVSKTQLFAWQAVDRGLDIHLQAEPTKTELVKKQIDSKKENVKEQFRQSIIDKYGGKEHLQTLEPQLMFGQTDIYMEYSRQGQVIKGCIKAKVSSIYEEDVFTNNHTTVWGSYWHQNQWGYKCCHSFIKNSYCTGNNNKIKHFL
ncbi:pre-mRNA-splicing factor SLU7-like [Oppia nitens]|uniref:pre-mRNA-splicing factor SLU7-like n=1 Tax=Oppia nitens TaxID=1686743 RepID=UPI0023DBC1F7|nr:pre-mRNA-splicing factor SLU7-like [Oppia nitens]